VGDLAEFVIGKIEFKPTRSGETWALVWPKEQREGKPFAVPAKLREKLPVEGGRIRVEYVERDFWKFVKRLEVLEEKPKPEEFRPAAEAETIKLLSPDELEPSPLQARQFVDDEFIHELAENIKAVGVAKPVLVRPKDGRFEVVAGWQTALACQKAGVKVPAKAAKRRRGSPPKPIRKHNS